MNFIHTIDANVECPIMLIDKHIGYDEEAGYGIMGDQFARELLTLDSLGKRNIHVWIASPGGSVVEGEKIYSAILNSKAKVDTYAMGMVASIAAVIFQAGRRRVMADYASLMYHNPYGGSSDVIKVFKDTISTMVCERAGQAKDAVLKMMDRTTWILASEAKSSGFCDEVLPTSEANRGRLSRVSNDAKELWKESVAVMNSILNQSNHSQFHKEQSMSLTKVYNRLDLVDGAKEEAIIAAIDKIENKYKDAAAEVADLKNKLQAASTEKTKVEGELSDLKNKVSEFEKAKAAAEKEALKVKAKNLINEYKEVIKGDKDKLIDQASESEAGFEMVKNILEVLPLNKKAPKLDGNKSENEAALTGVAANKMAELRNKFNL